MSEITLRVLLILINPSSPFHLFPFNHMRLRARPVNHKPGWYRERTKGNGLWWIRVLGFCGLLLGNWGKLVWKKSLGLGCIAAANAETMSACTTTLSPKLFRGEMAVRFSSPTQ